MPADNPARERLRVLEQLQADGLVQFHGVPFLNSEDGRVTDGFARLFGLTSSERSAVDAAILHSREAMDRLLVENATAREDAATNGLVIEIKAFPESGGRVHDEFMASIRDVLGDDRYQALQKLVPSPVIEAQFGQFGASERRIEFSRAGRDAEGRTIYAWNDAHEATWGESTSGGQGTQATILRRFGALATSVTPPVFWNEPRTP